MISTGDFCKAKYGKKLYKLSFNAGFGCPNRDGTVGYGGCIFCSEGGSGDFAVGITDLSSEFYDSVIDEKIAAAKRKIENKFKGDSYIAYFQAYSNTYADVNVLRKLYMSVIGRDDISVLSIATRPDCFDEDKYKLIENLNRIKPVWVELGLQTSNEKTAEYINRGYSLEVYDEAVRRLNELGVHVITHMILYLPGEDEEMMEATLRHIIEIGSGGVKLQLLHVLKNTRLGDMPIDYKIPSLDEYVHTVKRLINIMPDDMVVHRMTGDAPRKDLIEPKWSADKKKVLNAINNELRRSN